VKKHPTRIHVRGSEVAVKKSEIAIAEWIEGWELKHPGQRIVLDRLDISYLLGPEGSADRKSIQQEFGVKVDINTFNSALTIRGGKIDSQNLAMESLRKVLLKSVDSKNGSTQNAEVSNPGNQSPPKRSNHEILESNDEEILASSSPKEVTNTIQLQDSGLEDSDSSCTIPTNVIKNDSKLPNKKETTTGKLQSAAKLYNFLVSDDAAPSTTGDLQEPWDSSTVSSAVENIEEGYFRSSSGFTIRL